MKKNIETKHKQWDDLNPIRQVIFEKSDKSSLSQEERKFSQGPKLERNTLFQLDREQPLDSYRSETILVPIPETTLRKTNEIIYSNKLPDDSNISAIALNECSNFNSNIFQKRRTSISRISHRFGKFSKKRMSEGKTIRSLPKGITLKEIIFRQKLERFIKNIRSQCGLNDLRRLDTNQLRILNDKSASEYVILKLNYEKTMQKKKDNQLKAKVMLKPLYKILIHKKRSLFPLHIYFLLKKKTKQKKYIKIEFNAKERKRFIASKNGNFKSIKRNFRL